MGGVQVGGWQEGGRQGYMGHGQWTRWPGMPFLGPLGSGLACRVLAGGDN
jgi:hypothetical protein